LVAEIDIYRAANLIIKQRGALEAEIEAAQRADELLAAGDMDGRGVWLMQSGANPSPPDFPNRPNIRLNRVL